MCSSKECARCTCYRQQCTSLASLCTSRTMQMSCQFQVVGTIPVRCHHAEPNGAKCRPMECSSTLSLGPRHGPLILPNKITEPAQQKHPPRHRMWCKSACSVRQDEDRSICQCQLSESLGPVQSTGPRVLSCHRESLSVSTS